MVDFLNKISGLFHRAILIAGSAHAPWALVSDPSSAAAALAQSLNCSLSSSSGSNSSSPVGNSSAHSPAPPPTSAPFTSSLSSSRNGRPAGPSQDPIFECIKNKHFSEFSRLSPPKFSTDFGPSIDGVVIKPNFRVRNNPSLLLSSYILHYYLSLHFTT